MPRYRVGTGDFSYSLVNGYPKGTGGGNNLPEAVWKSEQLRRRGQAVLLRNVGTPSESGQFFTRAGLYIWWMARPRQNCGNDYM